MSVTLVNPYCTRAEVQAELKNTDSTQAVLDDIDLAINMASRWVDNYLHRDFFQHDHSSSALVLHQHSHQVIHDTVYLSGPVISLSEVKIGDNLLVQDTDFLVVNPQAWELGGARMIRTGWSDQIGRLLAARDNDKGWNPWLPDYALSIKGLIGYAQPSYVSVLALAAGGTNYTANDVLTVVGGTGTAATITVLTVSGAGAILTASITEPGSYTVKPTTPTFTGGTGTAASFTLTFATDQTQVPSGIPSHITLATKLVAAALTGHNKKDSVGLDGGKVTLNDRAIPKTVFDMLGRRAPVLI
jgi:hypothetical protein